MIYRENQQLHYIIQKKCDAKRNKNINFKVSSGFGKSIE